MLLTNLPEGFLSSADDTGYVLAVADGMGGQAFGELASMLALRSGWEQTPHAIKWTWIINDREIDDLREQPRSWHHGSSSMKVCPSARLGMM